MNLVSYEYSVKDVFVGPTRKWIIIKKKYICDHSNIKGRKYLFAFSYKNNTYIHKSCLKPLHVISKKRIHLVTCIFFLYFREVLFLRKYIELLHIELVKSFLNVRDHFQIFVIHTQIFFFYSTFCLPLICMRDWILTEMSEKKNIFML